MVTAGRLHGYPCGDVMPFHSSGGLFDHANADERSHIPSCPFHPPRGLLLDGERFEVRVSSFDGWTRLLVAKLRGLWV